MPDTRMTSNRRAQLPRSDTRAARRAGFLTMAALALAAALYAVVLTALWFGQERLLFHPVPLDAGQPLAQAPDVFERSVDVPGARLSLLELRLPDPKGVVFFLHGNAGNLQTWFVNTALYRQANYDLVMFDYRGFGKSTGRIESEAQLQADVQAVWQQVAPRYRGRHVIIFGRSLGTGLAATLAARVQPDLTMLASPYVSMVALAAQHYPWVPAGVLRYPLRTDAQLAQVRTPVVLLHGDQDRLIPIGHSQALLTIAPHARLFVVRGAGHGDLQEFDSYLQAVRDCLHDD
jgi:pimeloyl-ACP methyl ester carboxylesterase